MAEVPKNATEQAVDKMESPVELMGFLPSLGEAAQVSIAISLKRIADAQERIASCVSEVPGYMPEFFTNDRST